MVRSHSRHNWSETRVRQTIPTRVPPLKPPDGRSTHARRISCRRTATHSGAMSHSSSIHEIWSGNSSGVFEMKKIALVLVALCAGALATPAFATLQVDVHQGNVQPLPIAIPDFIGDPSAGPNIAKVVRADLDRSGLFKPPSPKSFVEQIKSINAAP